MPAKDPKNSSDPVWNFYGTLETRSRSLVGGFFARFAWHFIRRRENAQFNTKERNALSRRETSSWERKRRSFISIDRRSRGVGEIVYLARRRYSERCPDARIFLESRVAWVYRRRNLPRLRRPSGGHRHLPSGHFFLSSYFRAPHFASLGDFAIRSASYLVSGYPRPCDFCVPVILSRQDATPTRSCREGRAAGMKRRRADVGEFAREHHASWKMCTPDKSSFARRIINSGSALSLPPFPFHFRTFVFFSSRVFSRFLPRQKNLEKHARHGEKKSGKERELIWCTIKIRLKISYLAIRAK